MMPLMQITCFHSCTQNTLRNDAHEGTLKSLQLIVFKISSFALKMTQMLIVLGTQSN